MKCFFISFFTTSFSFFKISNTNYDQDLHFQHSYMPDHRKIPMNLTLFPLVASTYFDKCKIASNTPPATHLALSDI